MLLIHSDQPPDAGGRFAALPGLALTGIPQSFVTLSGAVPATLLPSAQLHLVDGTDDVLAAKQRCERLASLTQCAVLVCLTEVGFSAVREDWPASDFISQRASIAELDARVRLLQRRTPRQQDTRIHAADLIIDEANYSARLGGKPLDLTFKEFELLRFLAANPLQVFTREQLLGDVWGMDYYGGTRTVDVHVRRLRAKLGEHEHLIGTVRNVGYRFDCSHHRAEEGAF